MPYAVSLKGGRFNYDNGKIEAESLAGAIGRSSFSGLTGSVRADGTGQLNIKSASLQLDLEQTEVLLRKVETFKLSSAQRAPREGKLTLHRSRLPARSMIQVGGISPAGEKLTGYW